MEHVEHFLTEMHASSTLLRNDSNTAHVEHSIQKKSRRFASTFALEGGAGEGPREISMIIEVYIVYERRQFRR